METEYLDRPVSGSTKREILEWLAKHDPRDIPNNGNTGIVQKTLENYLADLEVKGCVEHVSAKGIKGNIYRIHRKRRKKVVMSVVGYDEDTIMIDTNGKTWVARTLSFESPPPDELDDKFGFHISLGTKALIAAVFYPLKLRMGGELNISAVAYNLRNYSPILGVPILVTREETGETIRMQANRSGIAEATIKPKEIGRYTYRLSLR